LSEGKVTSLALGKISHEIASLGSRQQIDSGKAKQPNQTSEFAVIETMASSLLAGFHSSQMFGQTMARHSSESLINEPEISFRKLC
jgi:hypothetical protein